MDSYKRLRIDYWCIRSIILAYTSAGNIVTYLDGLDEAIQTKDKEQIIYCLDKIIEWYDDSMEEIQYSYSDDSYFSSYGGEDHEKNLKMIVDLYNEMLNYEFNIVDINQEQSINQDGDKKIFLSHSSADKKYADALEKFIVGLGVEESQLIYTSHPLHKVPLGENIYDYLRKNINDQVFMIILWSNDYLKSPACMSEMGAAWVKQTDYIGIYTPDFDFGSPEYRKVPVDTSKMGAVLNGNLNCRASMIELKNKIQDFFCLANEEKKIDYLLEQFMNEIK